MIPDKSMPQTEMFAGIKYSIIVNDSILLLELPCKYIIQGWGLSYILIGSNKLYRMIILTYITISNF